MSLQQDVLDSIGPQGVERDKLRERVGNIGQGELDVAVNALLRAQRLRLTFGRYEVVASNRPLGTMPTRAQPPTATEELAANIGPATRVCQDCGDPKELEKEFSRSNLGKGYLKTCKRCVGKRSHAGKAQGSAPTAAAAPPAIKVTSPIAEEPPPVPPLGSACENAKARRQAALNKIAMLELDLANQRAVVTRCDDFLVLHAEFAEGDA
jgi:hypothetical protein